MARSLFTLETAREILLGERPGLVTSLDRLLGLGILAAGPVGLATGQPWLLAVWGWVDQKNELMARLAEAVTAGRRRLGAESGRRQRHEVLAATHTVLVVAAFLDALQRIGGEAYRSVEFPESELDALVMTQMSTDAQSMVECVARMDVPMPWDGGGFQANLDSGIRAYYQVLAQQILAVFDNFAPWVEKFGSYTGPRPLNGQIVELALDRYRAEYVALVAEVPEFAIWSSLGEHHATHRALSRLEALVASLAPAPQADVARERLARLNRDVLNRPILDLQEITRVSEVRAPTVAEGYLEPRFRWAVMTRASRPAHEGWWSHQQAGTDLAGFLATHFTSPQAAVSPLIVLGHPGAGKSLFTKVCAARLSATAAFMAVRIALRDAPEPSAGVYQHIEDVLRESTHGRIAWRELGESGDDVIRVVLIDGLDELMQATGATESRYLRAVTDFQRTELATGGPVAVVVTSRTVVADLAAIPDGCMVVKLEEFDDDQIGTWAERWNDANAGRVQAGSLLSIDAVRLREYGPLARQPLLLALLAIILTERDLPSHERSADLYRTLLDDFIRRELDRPDRFSDRLSDDERYEVELWKLGIVAFGMLNRSQQYLHEDSLTEDLRALPARHEPAAAPQRREISRQMDPASRLIGRFFFVHTDEAAAGAGGRSYEFLHATFADYLVAFHTRQLLREAAGARKYRSSSQPWDDDLLFALISHIAIGASGSLTLEFFAQLATADSDVASVLEHLAVVAHHRWGPGRHHDYDPSGRTPVQRVAAYSANIVVLRLAIAQEPVPIARLCPPGADVQSWWPSQVRLWDAVLTRPEMMSLLTSTCIVDDAGPALIRGRHDTAFYEDLREYLALDREAAFRVAAGRALQWDPRDTGDYHLRIEPAYAAAVHSLTRALRTGVGGEEALRRFREVDDPTASLHLLRIAVMAQCVAELDYPFVAAVLDDAIRARVPVPQTDLGLIYGIHPQVREYFGKVNRDLSEPPAQPDTRR
ncbi:hypothetical protein AB0G04_10980 [Actinoplanes sp. NPDC023801]|uniref:NACHT domain-containing protein n=1 Tax=Actinoplanes sp. NPDC023801 TaxID=3154595 RepID=UPI0033C9A175